MNRKGKCPRIIVFLIEVVKKLWGYIKKIGKQDCIIVHVIINCECDKKKCETAPEIDSMSKDELIDTIAVSAKLTTADAGEAIDAMLEMKIKLRRFKAMEPDI